jgi:hypothetical protein
VVLVEEFDLLDKAVLSWDSGTVFGPYALGAIGGGTAGVQNGWTTTYRKRMHAVARVRDAFVRTVPAMLPVSVIIQPRYDESMALRPGTGKISGEVP